MTEAFPQPQTLVGGRSSVARKDGGERLIDLGVSRLNPKGDQPFVEGRMTALLGNWSAPRRRGWVGTGSRNGQRCRSRRVKADCSSIDATIASSRIEVRLDQLAREI